jgi:hypothetical protein
LLLITDLKWFDISIKIERHTPRQFLTLYRSVMSAVWFIVPDAAQSCEPFPLQMLSCVLRLWRQQISHFCLLQA